MKQKKKVAIIGSVGLPSKYGGFETLADHLVKQLGDQYEFTVYCTSKKYPKAERKKTYEGARLRYIPLDANGVQSIPYDSISIFHALFYADVLLILGVAGAWMLPFVKLFTRKKIIISVDGIEWKRNKWSRLAKWYLWWAEKMAVKYSHADISDNESIQDYTAVRYGTLSHIIEYGADHTLNIKPTQQDKEKYTFLNKPYAFKVCRIEPENNIHIVLESFARLGKYTLVIVGNWNISEYGQKLKEKYSGYPNLVLLDPIYNQQQLDLIRGNAFIYLHGHSAGGTNPSLVEAMHLGLPVVTYDVSYNRTTTEGKAFYFRSEEDITRLVQTKTIAEWKANGTRMKEVADRRYKWQIIAAKYDGLIRRVLAQKGKVPVRPAFSNVSSGDLLGLEAAHLETAALFYEKRY